MNPELEDILDRCSIQAGFDRETVLLLALREFEESLEEERMLREMRHDRVA